MRRQRPLIPGVVAIVFVVAGGSLMLAQGSSGPPEPECEGGLLASSIPTYAGGGEGYKTPREAVQVWADYDLRSYDDLRENEEHSSEDKRAWEARLQGRVIAQFRVLSEPGDGFLVEGWNVCPEDQKSEAER